MCRRLAAPDLAFTKLPFTDTGIGTMAALFQPQPGRPAGAGEAPSQAQTFPLPCGPCPPARPPALEEREPFKFTAWATPERRSIWETTGM